MNTGRSETAVIEQPDQAGRRTQNTDIAALTDGRFIAALLVLIANDHWLKAEYGNWLTGKASDIAGLIMLPVVVVCALRLARLPDRVGSVIMIIGAWFTAIKVWPTTAVITERLAETVTGIEHQIIADPTDLIGLVGLGMATRIIAAPRPLLSARSVRIGLLALGLVATMASSNSWTDPVNDLIVDEATGEVSVIRSAYNGDLLESCESIYVPHDVDPDVDSETEFARAVEARRANQTDDMRELFEDCTSLRTGKTGAAEFVLQTCPELSTFVCIRGIGAAIEVSRDGSSWDAVWALDDDSPTTYNLLPQYDYNYDPQVQDLVVDRWGTTHVTYRGGLYLTRSEDGEWSQPFSHFRQIAGLTIFASAAMAISGFAISYRRSRSRGWWVVPVAAVAAYVAVVAGNYAANLGMPFGVVGGLGFFGIAVFVCAVLAGRYSVEIPGRAANVGLALVSAALVPLPFLIWKYAVSVSFNMTWSWLVLGAICSFAIDTIVGRRIAAQPMPPPPRPTD